MGLSVVLRQNGHRAEGTNEDLGMRLKWDFQGIEWVATSNHGAKVCQRTSVNRASKRITGNSSAWARSGRWRASKSITLSVDWKPGCADDKAYLCTARSVGRTALATTDQTSAFGLIWMLAATPSCSTHASLAASARRKKSSAWCPVGPSPVAASPSPLNVTPSPAPSWPKPCGTSPPPVKGGV
jgi:hypothetical protein